MADPRRARVAIIGAGFGGLSAAKALRRAPVDVMVVDRENYHLFQPLVYQVAMAELSGPDISASTRAILARQKNTSVRLGEVSAIDLDRRLLTTQDGPIEYDYLIVAGGTRPNYFGKEGWEQLAPSPKGLDAAYEIRKRVLYAFEEAEALEGDSPLRRRLLEFVIIGGGPTGVEFAGALAELSRRGLKRDFRRIDPGTTKVHLIEGGPHLLAGFPEDLSVKAAKQLGELGVIIHAGRRVVELDVNGVTLDDASRLDAATVIWAAGVKPVGLAEMLSSDRDREGRVRVGPDLSLPGHPEVFVIGDMAHFEQDGKALPGLSPVALQGGRSAARNIVRTVKGEEREPFRYFDKGMLATIGRSRAVGVIGRLHFSGFIAWAVWALVHIFFLVGFRNRVAVLLEWSWNYLTDKHSARIITGLRHPLRGASGQLPAPAVAHSLPAANPPRPPSSTPHVQPS
jgi:NADH:ubiquinone reductase (H+-translocating)